MKYLSAYGDPNNQTNPESIYLNQSISRISSSKDFNKAK